MRFVKDSCPRIVRFWRFPWTRRSQTICGLLCRPKIPIASLRGLSMLVFVFVSSKLLGFGCVEFQSNAFPRCHQRCFFCCIHPGRCCWNLIGGRRGFRAKWYPRCYITSVAQLCWRWKSSRACMPKRRAQIGTGVWHVNTKQKNIYEVFCIKHRTRGDTSLPDAFMKRKSPFRCLYSNCGMNTARR